MAGPEGNNMANDDELEHSEQPEDRAPGAGPVRPTGRPAPRRPSARSEKALGLEVARLFGLSPRLLMAPSPPATEPEAGQNQPPEASDP